MVFSRVITKKPYKIVKFKENDQTFRNTYLTRPKRSRIKLVVPSNLLKQENVCLIPHESEHPSIAESSFSSRRNYSHLIFPHYVTPLPINAVSQFHSYKSVL